MLTGTGYFNPLQILTRSLAYALQATSASRNIPGSRCPMTRNVKGQAV